MAAAEIEIPKVLVFDGTDEQWYLRAFSEAITQANWAVRPYDDLEAALDDLDESISAVVTTLCPELSPADRMEPDVPVLPLIDRAQELRKPLAIVSPHPAAYQVIRNDSLDIVVGEGFYSDEIRLQLVAWLVEKAGVQLTLWEELETRQHMPERSAVTIEETGSILFGSPAKTQVGVWIRQRDVWDGDFTMDQISKALPTSSTSIAGVVSKFCELGMMSRSNRGWYKQFFYRREDSPLWAIFDAVAAAANPEQEQPDEVRAQRDRFLKTLESFRAIQGETAPVHNEEMIPMSWIMNAVEEVLKTKPS